MLSLIIGDNLLVRQVAEPFITPWGYRIINIATGAVVATAAGLTASHVIAPLLSATYLAYVGTSLLLEILNGSNVVIESDEFLISGVSIVTSKLTLLVGLHGENVKHSAPLAADFQDGHEKHREVILYTDETLATELATYDWAQTFVADFIPDARFQVQKVIQKESA